MVSSASWALVGQRTAEAGIGARVLAALASSLTPATCLRGQQGTWRRREACGMPQRRLTTRTRTWPVFMVSPQGHSFASGALQTLHCFVCSSRQNAWRSFCVFCRGFLSSCRFCCARMSAGAQTPVSVVASHHLITPSPRHAFAKSQEGGQDLGLGGKWSAPSTLNAHTVCSTALATTVVQQPISGLQAAKSRLYQPWQLVTPLLPPSWPWPLYSASLALSFRKRC